MADQVISKQGDTLDGLLWRERALQASDLAVVIEANPGLAALGEELPTGTIVVVPAAAAKPASAILPLTQLWD